MDNVLENIDFNYPNTNFAPAERYNLDSVRQQAFYFQNSLEFKFLKHIQVLLMVINDKRQVVFANDKLLNQLGIDDLNNITGYRPGEVFGCVNAFKEKGGCGTSDFCRICNLLGAVLESTKLNERVIKEVRVTSKFEGTFNAFDFRVTSVPMEFNGKTYFVINLEDISKEKYKERLERTFFHDILNKAGAIQNLSELIIMDSEGFDTKEIMDMIFYGSKELVNEIKFQNNIINAENDVFSPEVRKFDLSEIVKHIAYQFEIQWRGKGLRIEVIKNQLGQFVVCDEVIINRIVTNLIKNACEAAIQDEKITVKLSKNQNLNIINVHNSAFIPLNVQMQIFQRSFSTKGHGRGIGTYSIKLFTEKYLNGQVNFESSKEKGTTFTVEFPDMEG